MNVSNVQNLDPTLSAPSAEVKRMQLQALLLRKSLESQQTESDTLMRMTDGKGQNLDIRV